jgi:hypothetical protein
MTSRGSSPGISAKEEGENSTLGWKVENHPVYKFSNCGNFNGVIQIKLLLW